MSAAGTRRMCLLASQVTHAGEHGGLDVRITLWEGGERVTFLQILFLDEWAQLHRGKQSDSTTPWANPVCLIFFFTS